MQKLTNILKDLITHIEKKHHIPAKNILLASSVCADELNHNRELYEVVPSAFQMGGLGGYPHAGTGGFNAYLDHIPDDGAGIILYGPHIGKNQDEISGFLHRSGQERETTSCGALWGILNDYVKTKGNSFENYDNDNMQFIHLANIVHKENLLKDDISIRELTNSLYKVIHSAIISIIKNSNYGNYAFQLFLLGGIIVNTRESNFFDPKDSLQMSYKNGKIEKKEIILGN